MLIIQNIQNILTSILKLQHVSNQYSLKLVFDHHFIVKGDYHLCKMLTKNNNHLYHDETESINRNHLDMRVHRLQ